MCGITGYIDFNKTTKKENLGEMVNSLKHRGPDNQGYQYSEHENCLVGLGHARLSVIDLSEEANQPFISGDLSMVFNGEVYNYLSIKKKLREEGVKFTTSSDTEVVLAAYKKWGIEAVHKFTGMFAFAIYDKATSELLLCRDRAGVKPLFYYYHHGLFLFGSELKALISHPHFEKGINQDAVVQFLEFGYVPGPISIFNHTFKLEPGSVLKVSLHNKKIIKSKYWDLKDFSEKPLKDIGYEQAKEELDFIIKESCNYRMVADVPVGVFLSGGYDSSCVTAMLQKDRTERIKTYTIAFPDGQNEAPFAEDVAKYLGTDHTTIDCTINEAKDIIPLLPEIYDEPNADISCIPTYLISKYSRGDVKVALSADGGDEAFAGYSGYSNVIDILNKMDKLGMLSKPISALMSASAKCLPSNQYWLSNKLTNFSQTLKLTGVERTIFYAHQNQKYPQYLLKKLIHNYQALDLPSFSEDYTQVNENYNALLLLDFKTVMRDLLLVKVDRASMANSLEVRDPLLDHKIFEYAAQLPMKYKYDGSSLKRILKDIVHQYIPLTLMDRPKMGFDLPIYNWLRQDLSYVIDHYLGETMIKKTGVFRYEEVQIILKEFKQNSYRYPTLIWRMITYQMWYEKWF